MNSQNNGILKSPAAVEEGAKQIFSLRGLRPESPIKSEDIGKAIWKTALEFLGELGVARSGLRIVDFDEAKQKGIIKVNHTSVEEGRVVLSLVKEINKKKVALRVIGVSGILKKARGKWV